MQAQASQAQQADEAEDIEDNEMLVSPVMTADICADAPVYVHLEADGLER